MAKNVKKRHWAFVLYPESAPSDWVDILSASGLAGAISPLHDSDLDATGEVKKPHYHIIVSYSGPTTFSAVKSFTDSLNQPIPQPLESVRGYYRYLTHQDNPEKHQYDAAEIQTFGGFDISDYVERTKSDTMRIIKSVQLFIREHNIMEYSDLLDILLDNDLLEEWEIAASHTLLFSRYVESKRYKEQGYGENHRT